MLPPVCFEYEFESVHIAPINRLGCYVLARSPNPSIKSHSGNELHECCDLSVTEEKETFG